MDKEAAASPVSVETRYRPSFLSHLGMGFLSGAIVGSTMYPIRAYRSAPAGSRLAAAGRAALVNAPRVGGDMGAYMALFYIFEGAMARMRRKHDRWNTTAASAIAMGSLHVHYGGPAAVVFALSGAAVGAALGCVTATIRTEKHLGSISIDHKQKGS